MLRAPAHVPMAVAGLGVLHRLLARGGEWREVTLRAGAGAAVCRALVDPGHAETAVAALEAAFLLDPAGSSSRRGTMIEAGLPAALAAAAAAHVGSIAVVEGALELLRTLAAEWQQWESPRDQGLLSTLLTVLEHKGDWGAGVLRPTVQLLVLNYGDDPRAMLRLAEPHLVAAAVGLVQRYPEDAAVVVCTASLVAAATRTAWTACAAARHAGAVKHALTAMAMHRDDAVVRSAGLELLAALSANAGAHAAVLAERAAVYSAVARGMAEADSAGFAAELVARLAREAPEADSAVLRSGVLGVVLVAASRGGDVAVAGTTAEAARLVAHRNAGCLARLLRDDGAESALCAISEAHPDSLRVQLELASAWAAPGPPALPHDPARVAAALQCAVQRHSGSPALLFHGCTALERLASAAGDAACEAACTGGGDALAATLQPGFGEGMASGVLLPWHGPPRARLVKCTPLAGSSDHYLEDRPLALEPAGDESVAVRDARLAALWCLHAAVSCPVSTAAAPAPPTIGPITQSSRQAVAAGGGRAVRPLMVIAAASADDVEQATGALQVASELRGAKGFAEAFGASGGADAVVAVLEVSPPDA